MTSEKQRKFNMDMLGFLLTYGALTQQALNMYIEYMREQARELKSSAELYEQIAAQAQRARNQLAVLNKFAEEL